MKENCFTFLEWSQLENVYRWEIGLLRRMWTKERTWSDTISASAFCMHSPFGWVLIMTNSSVVECLTNSSLDAAKIRPPTTFKGRCRPGSLYRIELRSERGGQSLKSLKHFIAFLPIPTIKFDYCNLFCDFPAFSPAFIPVEWWEEERYW
jgi:hypothetical protein